MTDELEIRWSEREISLEVAGESPPPVPANLVLRAAQSLRARRRGLPGARMILRKRIPVAAGLGGGSSDAAAALAGLVRLWDLEVSREELEGIAGELGADVPFFLTGGGALGRGRGDRITALPDREAQPLCLIISPFASPTEEAFRRWDRAHPGPAGDYVEPPAEGIDPPESAHGTDFRNDFEEVLLPDHPELAAYLTTLRGAGALAAALSGSGPSVYGVFPSEELARRAAVQRSWGTARALPATTVTRDAYARRLGAPLSD